LQSPLGPSSAPPTPTTPIAYPGSKGMPGGLEGTIAPTDMLNVLSAHRESVTTADGKKNEFSTKCSGRVSKKKLKSFFKVKKLNLQR
jgi:hypothetical protein